MIDQLPADERASFQSALQDARHAVDRVTPDDRKNRPDLLGWSHHTSNPSQDLMFGFLENGGVRLLSGQPGRTWQGTLRLKSAGNPSSWKSTGPRAERDLGELTEWYDNRPEGLEHGFTLKQRPGDSEENEPIVLRMELNELEVMADPDRAGDLIFTDPTTDQPVLGYRNLKVWDADGKQLPAEMRPSGDGFLIAVNDTHARYPVTVDPLIVSLEQSLLTQESDSIESIAISGNRIAVGSPDVGSILGGAVYLLERGPDRWVFEAKVVPTARAEDQRFGWKVALDGDTLAVNSSGAGPHYGNVYVFQRSGGTWTQQALLSRASQSLSLDGGLALQGDRLAVGASENYPDFMAVCVYQRSGSSWNAVGSPLVTTAGSGLGASVALDGMTVIAGAPDIRKAYVFRQTGSLWEEPVELIPVGLGPNDESFGASVAISGGVIAVGTPGSDFSSQSQNIGAVHLFTGSGAVWTHAAKLISTSAGAGARLGTGVALEGNTLATRGSGRVMTIFSHSGGGPWSIAHETLLDPAVSNYQQMGISISGGVVAAYASPWVYSFEQVGSTWTPLANYRLTGGAAEDAFGLSVDIDGDSAVVGALDYDVRGWAGAGKAWIFRRVGTIWNSEAGLLNGPPAVGDRFGVSVAISGDRAVIGADYDDEDGKADCGSATVFERGGTQWSQVAKFAPTPSGSSFGRAVAVDGDTVIIGAPRWNLDQGKVWSYQKSGSTWTGTEIAATSPQLLSQFGFSVAISGDRLIVGAPRTDIPALIGGGTIADAGRVHFFNRNPSGVWIADGSNSPRQANACAGFSVAIDGSTAVVGCSGPSGWAGNDNSGVTGRTGKAFVVTHNGTTWDPSWQALDATDLPAGSWFGMSVAIDADVLAIGAFGNNTVEGLVRIFQKAGSAWVKQTDLFAPGAEEADNAFGVSTALSGDTLLVGAYGADSPAGEDAGMAHVFRITGAGPALTITRSGSNAILTWPPTPGWILHRSPSLLPGTWQPVTVTTDGTHTHPIIPGEPKMFFRLQRP